MDSQLIEELLHENECRYLDFKRDQYPFANANDVQKAELLKDIVALANQDTKEVAYIIIGAKPVVGGGRSKVFGITDHLPEHSVQQFINGKTNRPIIFRYETVPCDGVTIGVLEIPSQPFVYLKADYGGLLKNICYTRRGSSTAEMTPDELLQRAERRAQTKKVPKVTFGPAEIKKSYVIYSPDSDRKLGESATLQTYALEIPSGPVPGYPDLPKLAAGHDFLPKLGRFLKSAHSHRPIGFFLENGPTIPALDVQCKISVPIRDDYIIRGQDQYPAFPTYPSMRVNGREMVVLLKGEIEIASDSMSTRLGWKIPKILPGQTVFSKGTFLVIPKRSCQITFEYSIFGENLPTPLLGTFELKMTVETKQMTIDEFAVLGAEFKKRRGIL